MAKLTRIPHKVFGLLADWAYQMGKFGSFKNGSPSYAADAADVQSLPNFEEGLFASLVGDSAPFAQDMNAALHHSSRQLGYLFQQGVAEWDSLTTYFIGSYCSYGGEIYKSKVDNNTGNTPDIGTNQAWELLIKKSYEISQDFSNANDYKKIIESIKSVKIDSPQLLPPSISDYISDSFSLAAGAYRGAIYSPNQDRVYFVPYGQSGQPTWHYYDCRDGKIHSYAHGATVVANAYDGGVYDAVNDRIIFCPSSQLSQANWHYIDCSTGLIVPYVHGGSITITAYSKGCISPKNRRLYFAPRGLGSEGNWNYLNLDTMTLSSYANTVSGELGSGAYSGAVYSPNEDRIYFIPLYQWIKNKFHYIDCATGGIVSYNNTLTGMTSGDSGAACFVPTEEKIAIVLSSTSKNFGVFISLSGGVPVLSKFSHGGISGNNTSYVSAAYSPVSNRIYLAPETNTNSSDFLEYIDCSNFLAVPYNAGSRLAKVSGYSGACYAPKTGEVIFSPVTSTPSTLLQRVMEPKDSKEISPIMSNCIFNKN